MSGVLFTQHLTTLLFKVHGFEVVFKICVYLKDNNYVYLTDTCEVLICTLIVDIPNWNNIFFIFTN